MKKKLISLITAAVMALGISVPAMAADAKPMEGKLVVVHTNDMHGYYETTETSIGIAGVAGANSAGFERVATAMTAQGIV